MKNSYTNSVTELKPAFVNHLQKFINENTISFKLTTRFDLSKEEIIQWMEARLMKNRGVSHE
jgi:hypothetical protein